MYVCACIYMYCMYVFMYVCVCTYPDEECQYSKHVDHAVF